MIVRFSPFFRRTSQAQMSRPSALTFLQARRLVLTSDRMQSSLYPSQLTLKAMISAAKVRIEASTTHRLNSSFILTLLKLLQGLFGDPGSKGQCGSCESYHDPAYCFHPLTTFSLKPAIFTLPVIWVRQEPIFVFVVAGRDFVITTAALTTIL